ncbi:RagB/SusD family nutrient uptake outer membrane protein [Chitinophaga filiformis]|uniref:RagB/SusD family nutrient uptake outer membrane protein n=1 Tax=Chitinophaga filiformis TaxID=104663 RepID=UPI001F28669C|nr:RagB/SusD family nutrient uptake outer membrane protein [Chitinophaga filiformis]MCF6401239.1 RagB/SusD family nutrient uptake outer membrane protein [Chitinophaga filiformis]
MKKIKYCFLLARGIFCLTMIILFLASCNEFLNVGDPPDKVVAQYVYEHNSSAIAVLNGIYFDLQSDNGLAQGRSGIAFNTSLSADEFEVPGSLYRGAYSNSEFPDFWSRIYSFIFRLNGAIEGLEAATLLTPAIKKQLTGEALFVRAFCYFYLVNLYGDVPLLTTTDYKINANTGRSPEEQVYSQIIEDLLHAEEFLSENFVGSDVESISDERSRPCKWAASALLSRVYLYVNKWADAESKASEVINKKQLFDIVPLKNVFLKNSMEAIWQLQPISSDGVFLHVRDAELYVPSNGVPNEFENPVIASRFLMLKFENKDLRKEEWLKLDSSNSAKYFFFYKYRTKDIDAEVSEYIMVFRLGEEYLIRAEARAQQNDIIGARADLNLIRNRAALPNTEASDKNGLLDAISRERQVELFIEWGHRWFDIKRTNDVDKVMMEVCPQKGGVWKSYKQYYPIPISDLQYNKNLKQNEGYPSL